MNARQRRDRARRGKRAAYARSQQISAREAMRPVTGRRSRVSYQGSGAAGYRSEWEASATRRDAIVIDRRWDDTISQHV